MRLFAPIFALFILLDASSATARRLPPDAGARDLVPADTGVSRLPPDAGAVAPAADAGVVAADAGVAADTGAYPDTGCPDGVCCLVLPDWDASEYDAGVVDTGRRRRRVTPVDAGTTPPEDGLFGCSATGVGSLLWLVPLVAARRRRRG
jgi:hypothetical protein